MIKNRRELLAMAAEWVTMAKNDMRRQIVAFMENVGTSEAELAHALGVSDAELSQILHGNGEITLTTFAKILIATDNVLEIKPMAATQFGGYDNIPRPQRGQHQMGGRPMPQQRPMPSMNGRQRPPMGMPMGGMMPPPMMGENGEMLPPPMFGDAMPPRFGGMPGMANRMPKPQPSVAKVPRILLTDTIIDNGWDSEIDLMNSTTSELMAFLSAKGVDPQRLAQVEPQRAIVEPTCPHMGEESVAQEEDVRFDEAIAKIAQTIKGNPELMRTLEQYL